jgi:NAD(P)-dependent dehydrogenase (short-subunit alcohol dehydrogenase family)
MLSFERGGAGVAIVKPFAELTPADWDRVLDIQLWGVLNGTYAFLPRLIAQAERTSPPLNPGQPVPAVRLGPGGGLRP